MPFSSPGRRVAWRLLFVVLLACMVVGSSARLASAAPSEQLDVRQPPCQFRLGFKAIRDLIPDTVGLCLENEHHNPRNGDALQQTTKGMLVWRKSDNFTAFTDGHRSWVNGPNGLQSRLNTDRFAWERDPRQPSAVSAAPPAAQSSASRPAAVAATARPAASAPARSLDAFIQSMERQLGQFWREELKPTTVSYRAPKVVLVTSSYRSSCGTFTDRHGAAYCPRDEVVLLANGFLHHQVGWPDEDAAVAIVIAHEWSHHVQKLVGLQVLQVALGYFTIQMELQADCFAGAFIDYAGKEGWFNRSGLDSILDLIGALGDERGTPWFAPNAHGTSEQRTDALNRGYRNGVNSCLRYTPLPDRQDR